MPEDLTTTAPSEAKPRLAADVNPAGPPGYELLDEIGRGGMGVVYRARDLALGRDVAVKLLAERYPHDSSAAQRFVNEARITGQLQHPGIPAVHQVGNLPDGRSFLAMKLIKGSTLEAVLKDRPNPSAERGRLLAVFEAVCQAVGYAHAHRVIHRDLKPANVMVGAFGEVQVMDWGLAKVLGDGGTAPAVDDSAPEVTRAWTQVSPTPETGSHTQAGNLVGTPAFIPPEQANGELVKVDERADVFGLGALLAVILTGKPPYVGESFESVRVLALRGKLDDCLARLQGCGAEPELVSLCRQCLAFEPADRPRDAGGVAQAVARLRSAAEERARTAEREKAAADARTEEQRRKRQWQFAAAGVVVVALAGGLLGLGDYGMQAVSELLMQKHHESHPTERADLFGKRFVATIETEEGKRLAEALMKQVTGGDPVRARKMRQDFFEFLPTHKIALAANHKPVVRGTDHAVWRRIKLVPFTVTIPDEEKDKNLPAKLKAEKPGILAWAIRGCLDWQRQGLGEPDEVRQATSQYQAEQDTVQGFISECCHLHPEAKANSSGLLAAYIEWSGDKLMTAPAFRKRMKDKGFESKEGTGGRYFWHGLTLKQSTNDGGDSGGEWR